MDVEAYQRQLRTLTGRLNRLAFGPPVSHVYNPLDYARDMHIAYVTAASHSNPSVLLLGMNPGPWGMAQTGVPFGEVGHVRDWLKLNGAVRKPKLEHPKRKIEGLGCPRSEVSGARLWAWAQERYRTPKQFFKSFLVMNYCPLSFMEQSGRNVTPDKLSGRERSSLYQICDELLVWLVNETNPSFLVGVGAFAEKRLTSVFGNDNRFQIGRILHPSPASPAANRDWAGTVDRQLTNLGIRVPKC